MNGHITLSDYCPLEVVLPDDESYLKIRETLTRIGIASRAKMELYQSCHLLFKSQKYFIVHFKELIALDGKNTDISQSDIQRRNTIAKLLEQWNLLTIIDPARYTDGCAVGQLKIVPFREKQEWKLTQKYRTTRP